MGTPLGTVSRRHGRIIAAAVVTAALAGCASWWNLGPQPDNHVGKGAAENLLTDSDLKAVTPQVAGDQPGGGVSFPVDNSAPGTATGAAPSTMPATAPVAAPADSNPAAAPVPESLSVQDAILTGLEHNVNLRIQRYSVPISRTGEERALSSFDPRVSGSLQGGRSVSGGQAVDSIDASASVTEFLPTGTTVQAGVTTSNNFYSESALSTGANLSVTQSLLRGAGLDVNLAALRQAEISTKVTQYQLRGVAETLVANIEDAYWDLALAELDVGIVQNSVDVSEKQLDDTRTRVRIERLAASELPAAEADLASKREALIDARSALKTQRLTFFQLLTPASRDFWDRSVKLTTLPFIPQGTLDPVESHVGVALRMRPDLNEALLQLKNGELNLVVTKNGLLPQLDMFVKLGKTGFSSNFGGSIASGFDNKDYSVIAGVQGDWEPINRSAKAAYRAAELTQDQLRDALDNAKQVAQLEVRKQYIEVERTRLQIDATRATREAAQATVAVQKGKFDAGSGTSLDLAIARRDLLSAQLSEVQAVINHLKALVEMYRVEGTLLARRGLAAPGAAPVEYKVK